MTRAGTSRRVLGSLAMAALLAAIAPASAHATTSSLTNVAIGTDDMAFRPGRGPAAPTGCDPDGTSTLRLDTRGPVTGSRSSRGTVSATVTFGPQTANDAQDVFYGYDTLSGQVTDVSGSFTMDVPGPTISGTFTGPSATPLGSYPNAGSCYGVGPGEGFGYSDLARAAFAAVAVTVDVAAVIDGQPVTARAFLRADTLCFDTTTVTGNCSYSNAQWLLSFVPLPLVVTADDLTRDVGAPNPPLTASAAGLVDGDALADLAGALSCTTPADASSPAGEYPITCNGLSSPKYLVTYAPGTLHVVKAPTALAVEPATTASTVLTQKATFAARLTSRGGAPVAGQTVRFDADTGETCSAVTDASGRATCTVPVLGSPRVLLAQGYEAGFAGTDRYLPASGEAPVTLL